MFLGEECWTQKGSANAQSKDYVAIKIRIIIFCELIGITLTIERTENLNVHQLSARERKIRSWEYYRENISRKRTNYRGK